MIRGFRHLTLDDDYWGVVKLMVTLPVEGDPWGVLSPIRGTIWGDQIRVVDAEPYSHALHGYLDPLMRVIGPEPKHLARRIPLDVGRCALFGECVGAKPDCRPGTDTPGCYEPPNVPPDVAPVLAEVVFAWKEGRYVLVVEGEGFNLA